MREKVRMMSEEERQAYYKELNEKRKKSRLQAESPDAITYWGAGKKRRTFTAIGKLVNLYYVTTKNNTKMLVSYVKCGAGIKRKVFYCSTKTAENQFLVMKRNTIVQMYGFTVYRTLRNGKKILTHLVIEVGQFATHPRLSEVMEARENIDPKLWKKVTVKGNEEEVNDTLEFLGLLSEDDD